MLPTDEGPLLLPAGDGLADTPECCPSPRSQRYCSVPGLPLVVTLATTVAVLRQLTTAGSARADSR